MKKFIAALSFLMLSTSAFAFQMQANCQFNRSVGQCSVYNSWGVPVYCTLRAQGQVASGAYGYAYENVTVYPGSYAYVYVYANNPVIDPLVFVTGNATCSY